MRIQHNILAVNSLRNLKSNNAKGNKALQNLSSGYRINSAADDAAGLGISEKMRALITGTAQAELNVQDGISLVEIADSAMQEIHAMMNRAYELGIQSANGTYSDMERKSMQEEIQNILNETDRIVKNTNFNGIPILQGSQIISGKNEVKYDGTLPAWVGRDSSLANGFMSSEYITTESYIDNSGATTPYQIKHEATYLDFSRYTGTQSQKEDLKEGGFYFTCCTCDNHYSIKFTSGTSNSVSSSGVNYVYSIGIDNINSSTDLVNAIIGVTDGGYPRNHYTKLTADTTNPSKLIIYDDRSKEATPIPPNPDGTGGRWQGWNNPQFNITANQYYGKFGQGVATAINEGSTGGEMVLQIGPDSADTLKLDLANASTDILGIKAISVLTQESSAMSINVLKTGINYLSGERGRMGAYKNRLEHTYNALGNSKENLTQAESIIRDADMAKELVKSVKNQILTQSATFMLSQANQSPQLVLQLLK